jgi:serine phosphatase RsbU (regulator of sigma subunit)
METSASYVDRIENADAYPIDCGVNLWSSPADGALRGGDWCEAFPLSDESVALTIGDVCGHGEPAADTMETMRTGVFRAIQENRTPSQVLSAANTIAYANGRGLIVTAISAILDRRRRTLTFANAGHPPPLVMTRDGHAFVSNVVGDLPLGIFAGHRSADFAIAIPDDALIVFYTDGITEHDRDIFKGEEELVEACRSAYDLPIEDAARTIARKILRKERGRDDAAVLAVRAVTTPGSKRLWIGACGPGGYRFNTPQRIGTWLDGGGDAG